MSHSSQGFLPTNAGLPLSYETIKEEYGVTELGEPNNSAVVRTTVINMPREVRGPVVWSLFNALFNACCLSFNASAHSVKSRDRKMAGDEIGAQACDSTAQCRDIGSLIFSILMVIICVIIFSTTSFNRFHKECHILYSTCPVFHGSHLALPLG